MLTVYRLFLKQISFLMSIRMTGTRGDGWPETTLPPLFLSQTHISIIVYCTLLLTSSDSSSYMYGNVLLANIAFLCVYIYIFDLKQYTRISVYLCASSQLSPRFSEVREYKTLKVEANTIY